MADGFSLNIDDSLLKNLEKADKLVNQIADSSQKMSKTVIESFKDANNNALKPFIENLNNIRKTLDSKATPMVFKEVGTQANQVVDKINKIATTLDKVFVGGKTYKFGALEKINYEIDEAVKKLSILQGKLNFYAKGEGQKAIGFADTTSMQKEAELLMQKIKLLEDERKSIIDNAKIRIQESQKQEQIDKQWMQMTAEKSKRDREATESSIKAIGEQYKAYERLFDQAIQKEEALKKKRIEAYGEQYRAYEEMFKKMEEKEKARYNEVINQINKEEQARKKAFNTPTQSNKTLSDVTTWQTLQSSIARAEQEIVRLNKSIRTYEDTMNRIKKTGSGHISTSAQREYQENLNNIDALKKKIETLKQVQLQIVQNNKALHEQLVAEQKLRDVSSLRPSMSDLRSQDELRRMREYYKQLEKESARAEQIKAREAEKAAKAKQKADKKAARDAEKAREREAKAAEEAAKREIIAAERAKQARINQYKQQNYATNTSFQGALNFSNEAKTIDRRTKAIQYLTEARNKLSQSDSQYEQKVKALNRAIQQQTKEIERLTGKTHELRKSHANLLDTAGQLQRKLALVFSVSQIYGYIGKLIHIRGEFELQQKSLEVLLQNKDEADKLWKQTIDLAVKSPFRVKQLVTYTRQLAAYRIETEKLHDTTRRLSDVSAGLGVDMQRIILAFGQVRAANFLRGTELRQFTEAGIPMLDELAKYFTELEGRAISAGDVFEMISKRMVSFTDVEEVFHRMTNAGGVFYKMQEEQSKTLSGLISNLHDSVDLMLNDIGKANDGILKGSVNTLRKFVDSWREVAYTLERVVIAYSLYKIANAAFILGSKNAATTTLWWNNALKAKIGTTMADIQTMTLQEASLYGVSKGQYAAGKATMFFQGAIRGVGLALKMARPFLLAFIAIEIVRYLTAASRAAAELQRELEEIYQSDYTNFKKQSYTLKDLVERLKNVTKGSQEHKDIISKLNSSYGEYLGNLNEETATYENLAASIDKVIMALSQKAKAQTLEKAIAKSFEKTNKEIMSLQEDITNGMERLVRESGGAFLVPQEQEINDFFNIFEKKIKETDSLLSRSDINKILSDYYGENVMLTGEVDFSYFTKLGEQILEQKQQEEKVQRQINNLYGEGIYSTKQAREEFKKLEEEKEQALKNETTRIGRQKIETQFEMARIDLQVKYEGLDKNIADYRKSLAKGISATVKDINRQIIESIPELGEDVADKIFIDQATAATGLESIAESTAQAYKGQLELIKQQNALKDAGTVYDQKLLANAERMAKGYYKRLEIMGRLDLLKKSSNDSDSKELQLLNRQLSAIKDASSAFESLSDIYGGEEAKKKVASSFANLFKELNISEVTNDMDFDALGVVRVLNELPNIAGERGEQAIEKLKAEFDSEIDVDLRIGRVKTIEEQISEMFSGYELSIELDKMNIPEDLAQSLFNIKATSLPELKEQIKFFEDELLSLGDKGVELWNKSQKKIEEVEKKTQLERLKKYVKYLVQAQGERVKIKMDEIRQLNEIETLGFTDAQKSLAKQAIQEQSKQKMDKLEWEDFKDSGLYVQLFEDLEYASTSALTKMRERLILLKEQLSSLDADDLRNLYNQVEKLDDELAKRNPYKTFILGADEYINAIKESKRIEKELDTQHDVTTGMKNKEVSLSEEIAKEKNIYEQMSKNKNISQEDLANQRTKINFLNAQLAALKAQLKAQGLLTDKLEQQLDGYKNVRKTFEGSLAEIGGDISEAANALPNIASDLENVFGAMDEGTRDTIDSISTIGAGVGDAIQGFASGNYIQAVAGVAKALGGIFAIGDKKKERQIQREIKFVEDLERAYEKLEKQIDKAYEFDTLKGSYDAAQKNIDEQIASYNKMIAAEEDKKKTDKDRIKEWQQAIEDLSEQRKELLKSQVEELGGGYDYSSMTEDFVNAWLDAFKDTGNGLKGLEENFEDFWTNIALKQAVMGGASKIMQPFLDAVNKALENDFKLDDSEMANIDQLSAKAKEDMNAFLEQWYDRWGDFMTQGEQSELSGLQRGIQGVTEETAQIIEAYLNSIRFFVAEQNTYLSQIAASFGNTEVENPMVEQLRIIASQTSAINTLLQSLTRGGHTLGGVGLKVFIS